MPKKTNDFENNVLRLQEISEKISMSDISLEEASKLYEEGMKLSKMCKKYLEEKELIIERINKN
ncbi:exodeoxyribonuclease VII, small subunit [Peptoanaerobacter stomatis]|uniref:Exodeoxyribonuclease VII small subunit n=1 Tax=Peptoanaerobacter stomatis TaxID=796937 RepID=J6HAT7_9FIRM|nr:exodeoxyribonuclease VII small subunit [Peptoanaerobacter stomatis]EJU19973.1 exodeoxyribonuclease VII, small subunit [Peptoanaerobacter stomatis]NWO25077.1 exodeoxyribonuclease VII small subunit [Peptostreptococcaceae bacterium oral taxon 081]